MSVALADGWLDANVILCHLTGEPPDMAGAVARLFDRAQCEGVKLRVHPTIVAETVWILSGVYHIERRDISRVLRSFLRAECIICEEREVVLQALEDYATLNVDLIDAILARRASGSDTPVCYTFDLRHFRRLGCVHRDPREL